MANNHVIEEAPEALKCLPWVLMPERDQRSDRDGLTFELRGRSRNGAWPARRTIDQSASRAKCHAGGGPARVKG